MSSPQTETEPSTAAQLIDALLAGGQPVDEGSFSLDTAAAAAKLDAYQYADRSTYLIPIAEAARGLDARRISLTTRDEDLLISIEGVELSEPERFFADPFAQLRGAESDRASRALGRLGVGLHMALGHAAIERVAISHSSTSQMLAAEYRRDAPVRLARQAPEVNGELRVLIDRPWRERFSLRGASREELEHLRRAVEYSRAAFEIDGRVISGRERSWDYVTRGSGAGFRYEGGLETEGERTSVIELWSEDVCVDTLPGPGIAFRAAVHLDAPRRDLSQMRIVRDEVVSAALEAVELGYRKSLARLAEHDAAWSGSRASARPSHWPEQRVDRTLGRPVREPEPEHTPKKSGAGFLFGLAFYGAGIGAGAIGFGALAHGALWGLFALIFLFTHGATGAGVMAKSIRSNKRDALILQGVLFAIGFVVALLLGLAARSPFD
ncbi:MAG TPA: hypothetical protein VM869_17995 [Enhygromyxa sp.]|nr:hypothetical protein [Enhygromyxa sp.]